MCIMLKIKKQILVQDKLRDVIMTLGPLDALLVVGGEVDFRRAVGHQARERLVEILLHLKPAIQN